MKVALLNDQLNAGGAEKVLVHIANMLHSRGVQVMVVLFLGKAALDEQLHPGIPVFYLHRQGRLDVRAMRHLKQLVQYIDVVHIHSRYNLRYYMVASTLLGIRQPKVVFHEHVPAFHKLDTFTAWCFKLVDAYVAVMQGICDWAAGGVLPAAKVHYLPNIVAPPANVLPAVQQGNRMVMIGNFRPVKNHLFAIQLVQSMGHGASLDLYGMVEDEPYLASLRQYIAANGLQQRVHIIEGIKQVYDVLPQYALALHTASNETGPLVLLEYMHAGLPFITYHTGDVAANIAQQLPELLMDNFEQQAWLQRINACMHNQPLRSSLQAKMANVVHNIYSEEKYWERLSNVYSTVVSTTA